MKAYTDIEQSKKLSKILPIETSDMRYGYIEPYDFSDRMYDGGYDEVPYPKDFLKKNSEISDDVYESELPCWSLAALLYALPCEKDGAGFDLSRGGYLVDNFTQEWLFDWLDRWDDHKDSREIADNPIDAVVNMILKLKEKDLLCKHLR